MKQGQRFTQMAAVAMLVGLLTACAGLSKPKAPATDAADVTQEESQPGVAMLFVESEPGQPGTFTSRMFVNARYLHMNDSRAPQDFVLFDRKARVIYSVNNEDETVFEIHAKPVPTTPPIPIDYTEESQPSSAIPKVDGRAAVHYRYLANGKRCYDVVSLGGDFLPDVLAAMREFRTVLAGEHASTLDRIPREMLDPCDLALNVFYSTRHLQHGFPLREWSPDGYQRFLKTYYGDFSVEREVLTLPAGFRHYTAEDAVSGSVDH